MSSTTIFFVVGDSGPASSSSRDEFMSAVSGIVIQEPSRPHEPVNDSTKALTEKQGLKRIDTVADRDGESENLYAMRQQGLAMSDVLLSASMNQKQNEPY